MRHTLTRRRLLGGTLQTAALIGVAPWLLSARPRERGERVLVVIELEGGNDGLNTVLPIDDDRYYRARPTLASAASGAHRIADGLALHPSLERTAERLAEGRVAVVQGVGYPHPDRSHFRSMDIWHTGQVPAAHDAELDVDRRTASGWLGELAERLGGSSIGAVHVGRAPVPLALAHRGRQGAALDVELLGRERERSLLTARERQSEARRDDRDELAFARASSQRSITLERQLDAASNFEPRADWPGTRLARSLRTVAALIGSGFPARVYTVRLSGFDTHNAQARIHAGLLDELDRALAAFDAELERAGANGDVLGLAFSEFGRRVAENGSRGTDHGAAGPAFLFGPGVRGAVHGPRPDLARLDQGDVAFGLDFRAVYGAVERDWFGLEPRRDGPAALDGVLNG